MVEVIEFRGEELYGLGRVSVITYWIKLRAPRWSGGHVFRVLTW